MSDIDQIIAEGRELRRHWDEDLSRSGGDIYNVEGEHIAVEVDQDAGAVMVHASNHFLSLCDEVERLREALARAYQLVGQIEALHGDTKQVEALDFLVEALNG